MPKDRSLVRASDIGAWAFCHRAWWLANVQGVEHENPGALAAGTRAHTDHGRSLRRSATLQRLGLFLLAAGLVVGGAWLLVQVLSVF